MDLNAKRKEFGDIELADGRIVILVQQAYSDNDSAGNAAWFASGYLADENPEDETGPTVMVIWESLGAEEAENDADWASPVSVRHYEQGELAIK